jgi:hypothetical protein
MLINGAMKIHGGYLARHEEEENPGIPQHREEGIKKKKEGYQGRPSPDNPLPCQSVMHQDTLVGTNLCLALYGPYMMKR